MSYVSRMLVVFSVLGGVSLFPGLIVPAPAQNQPEFEEVIDQYIEALQEEDREEIREAWLLIDRNEDLKRYLQENEPNIYSSYKLQAIVFRLERLRERRLGAPTADTVQPIPTRATNTGREFPTSAERARNLPNQRRLPNQFRTPNRVRTPNQDILRYRDNSDRPSNQELLRRRRR